MRLFTRMLVLAGLLLTPAPSLLAQSADDPSGHWEGSVQIPGREVIFEVDLARNARGELSGTMNHPAEKINGLPLRAVVVDGHSISFQARRDQPFTGMLAADGRSISGEYTLSGYVLPFRLIRTGDAVIAAPVKSAAVGRELEGTWNGALAVNGTSLRLVLTIANQSHDTATARLISVDEGGLEAPVAITQKDSGVTLVNSVVASSFVGALNPERTELAGTYSQGTFAAPLTFRLARP
jgi:hypothetical protein